jgi:hypothetical protein
MVCTQGKNLPKCGIQRIRIETMFKTQWSHAPIDLPEDQQKKLDWEIADISEQLEKASDLIFHTVMLTDDDNGPIIIVDGETGNEDTLFLTYYDTPSWVDVETN